MFIKLKNNYNNYLVININEISSANVVIENLTDTEITYYVQILTKSNQMFKTDTVNCEMDDYMKDLNKENLKELLTSILCYVLNDTDDEELNRLKMNSLAFAIYLAMESIGIQLAYDINI